MTEQPSDQRPSLSQLAAQAESDPWACPRCGCRMWRVVNTYGCKTDRSIHRRRICRHCHHVRISVETMRPE